MNGEAPADMLRAAHLRVTSSRLALVELLLKTAKPQALDDIDLARHPQVGDRATVFRNLHAFTDAGVVTMLRGVGKRDLYEIAHKEHGHTHVTCTECGKTACVDEAPPPPKKHINLKGWKDIEPNLTWWGQCNDCTKG